MSTQTLDPVTARGTVRNFSVGVGQIFLQENWTAGALILLGIAVHSIPMAGTTALGTLIGTVSARLVGVSTAHGLQGYCGALVGAAAWATLGDPWPAALATVLGAAACPAVTAALAWLFALAPPPGGPLPVLTAPFCLVSGLIQLLATAVTAPTGVPATLPQGDPRFRSTPGRSSSPPGWCCSSVTAIAVERVREPQPPQP